MPTQFITKDQIKSRMSIPPELEGVDEALESAIIASQLRIESYLDSRIERADYVTKFFLDKDAYSGNQPEGLYRCYLKTGGVSEDSPTVVMVGGAWNQISTVLDPSEYYLNAEKGILYVSNAYHDMYLSVSYTAGYTDASEIPDWLGEGILAYAPVVLNFSQVNHSADAKNAESSYKTSGSHALATIDPYTRNIGFLIRPVF